jgi:Tfp pilus assembly protein PilF
VIGDFAARVRQGLEQLERSRFEEAERSFRAALSLNPRDDQLLHLVGIAQLRQGRAEDAVQSVQRAISLTKRRAEYHNTLGCALRNVGRVEEAIVSFERALKLAADYHEARLNLGQGLLQARRYAEAQALFERLLARDPADVDALGGLAGAKWIGGEFGAALQILRDGIARVPANRYLRFSLSELLLATGEFEAGWRAYLERPTRAQLRDQAGLGSDDTQALPRLPARLDGRTLKLAGEQGLGDELFFLRFAAELRARGAARVEAAVDARLADMLTRSGSVDACCAKDPRLLLDPHAVAIGDLPYLLASDASKIPPPLRLRPLERRVAEIAARLKGLPRPLVGVTWRGGTPPGTADVPSQFKALPFEAFAAFAGALPGSVLVLQRHPQAVELERLSACAAGRVADFSALNDDLEGMLALLAGLDEYVGVSNTNMHLYAGVGGHGKVLLPSNMEFRWMAQGSTSPWFPGFQVYRPGPDRDWPGVFERVLQDLGTARTHEIRVGEKRHEADHRE